MTIDPFGLQMPAGPPLTPTDWLRERARREGLSWDSAALELTARLGDGCSPLLGPLATAVMRHADGGEIGIRELEAGFDEGIRQMADSDHTLGWRRLNRDEQVCVAALAVCGGTAEAGCVGEMTQLSPETIRSVAAALEEKGATQAAGPLRLSLANGTLGMFALLVYPLEVEPDPAVPTLADMRAAADAYRSRLRPISPARERIEQYLAARASGAAWPTLEAPKNPA